jgi:hypothetical protein
MQQRMQRELVRSKLLPCEVEVQELTKNLQLLLLNNS